MSEIEKRSGKEGSGKPWKRKGRREKRGTHWAKTYYVLRAKISDRLMLNCFGYADYVKTKHNENPKNKTRSKNTMVLELIETTSHEGDIGREV